MNRKNKQAFQLFALLSIAVAFVAVLSLAPDTAQSPNASSLPSGETLSPSVATYEQAQKRASLGEATSTPDRESYPGMTLIPQAGTGEVLLLNHQAEVVKRWKLDAPRMRILPNCNLLVLHGTKWGIGQPQWRALRNTVREYSWEGELLWEHVEDGILHHDAQRLKNGNTLFVKRIGIPSSVRATIDTPQLAKKRIVGDELREVSSSGELIWSWSFFEHFPPASCEDLGCTPLSPKHPAFAKDTIDWTHVNTVQTLPENHWFDAGDLRFKPGNILVIPRNWSKIFLIDKDSKKIVWSYAGDYKGGLSGGHEAHMIPKGLPGAGNILVFDNGRETRSSESYILEIKPPTKELAWIYDVGPEFHSHAAGAMQRLPNGNTLISEDVPGRVFEVTPDGRTVWQHQSPVRTCRAMRYEYNHCPELLAYKNNPSS